MEEEEEVRSVSPLSDDDMAKTSDRPMEPPTGLSVEIPPEGNKCAQPQPLLTQSPVERDRRWERACGCLAILCFALVPIALSSFFTSNWYDSSAMGITFDLFFYPMVMFSIGIKRRHTLVPDEPWLSSAQHNLHWILLPYSMLLFGLLFGGMISLAVGPIPPSIPTNGIWLIISYAVGLVVIGSLVCTYLYLPKSCFCCCESERTDTIFQSCLGQYHYSPLPV